MHGSNIVFVDVQKVYAKGVYDLKIFFVNNGMTHYYNLVLNRLNKIPGVELILIYPGLKGVNIGDGVYQTNAGINFRVEELEEGVLFGALPVLKGIAKLIWVEKPKIVIISDTYIGGFMFNIPALIIMKLFGGKLILRSIPFRLQRYNEAKKKLVKNHAQLKPRFTVKASWAMLKGMIKLNLRKRVFNLPDAHVNYVDDAYEIYGSYGVKNDKIFVTWNSPDTDLLFSIRDSLVAMEPILPICEFRLIHVGRLIEWKRVDMLLQAFAKIKMKYDKAELIIIGGGPEERSLKDLCAKLNIEPDVKFLGPIHDPNLLGRYLLASTVYVLAGMGGLSINDAMCFGLPVICSVADGTEKKLVREGQNGMYFKEGDENDLIEKIVCMFDNPDLRKRMGENSTRIIREEININTVIDGYAKAFDYVLSSGK